LSTSQTSTINVPTTLVDIAICSLTVPVVTLEASLNSSRVPSGIPTHNVWMSLPASEKVSSAEISISPLPAMYMTFSGESFRLEMTGAC